MLEITHVTGEADLAHVRELFLAYADWIAVDLSFQDFEKEFAGLPGDYAPPTGCLLLALSDGKPAGCIALRKLEDEVCEMKRLYVLPEFNGLGLGRKLAEAIIVEAKQLNYVKMRLDTMPKMIAAQKLYHSLGFKEISPYRFNPVEGTVYMELYLK